MALLTGVLVSVTELIKMHMFGIIHRLSRPGRGETTRQIYVNYQPVSLSLIGTRVMQENGFGLCIIKSHHKIKTNGSEELNIQKAQCVQNPGFIAGYF